MHKLYFGYNLKILREMEDNLVIPKTFTHPILLLTTQ